ARGARPARPCLRRTALRSRRARQSLPGAVRGRRPLRVNDRILVVGATGFLGSFVAQRLSIRGAAALVRTSSDTSTLPKEMELLRGDLQAPPPLDGFATLVYCASMGFGHVPPLVGHLERAGVKRAVFISTTAIFTSLPSAS